MIRGGACAAVLALGLISSAAPQHSGLVLRGPYLQAATPTSIVVRWRTDLPSNSRVLFGEAPLQPTALASDSSTGTDHSIRLEGLTPNTRYYYAVGSSETVLAGSGTGYTFRTPPLAGTVQPVRFWVIGDAGTGTPRQLAVRDAYAAVAPLRTTDGWLTLGDNAYLDGTDQEFQTRFFDVYRTELRRLCIWPSYGNHEGRSADASTQTGPYFEIFSPPTNGEGGGVPSRTMAYFSFDYANIHFVCLDSAESDSSAASPMVTWLKRDLASQTQQWLIAYWHHAPYSRASHDSDLDGRMTRMRERINPILEAAGVDLVLGGHSHVYERSLLLDGHYGASSTLTPTMIKDGGNGQLEGTGAYTKTTLAPNQGTVYILAGSSGQVGTGTFDHPAMCVTLPVHGSVVLDIEGNRLEERFIDRDAAIRDHFTFIKPVRPAAASLTLDSPEVVGGAEVVANVSLASAAPPGGAPVLLGSSEANLVPVPEAVVVPEGATQVTVPVRTTAVSSATGVSLTCSSGGVVVTAPLQLLPLQLAGVFLSPYTAVGSLPVSGRVVLNGPAPNNTVIALRSTSKAASVPSVVTVAKGSASQPFPITTRAVSALSLGRIWASLGTQARRATVKVRPIGVASLLLNPRAVVGGKTVTGTVTLEAPAGPGDVVVRVLSDGVAAAESSTLTIPVGSVAGTFSIITKPVGSSNLATLRAEANGVLKTRQLTVIPPALSRLRVTPNPVVGSHPANGKVFLNGVATVDVEVTLTSSSPAASIPTRVTVPAGKSAAMFSVSTSAVEQDTHATIQATVGSIQRSADLAIRP